jgi:integrase
MEQHLSLCHDMSTRHILPISEYIHLIYDPVCLTAAPMKVPVNSAEKNTAKGLCKKGIKAIHLPYVSKVFADGVIFPEKMTLRISITRKDKFLSSEEVSQLLDAFIKDATKGKRTRRDGKRIHIRTIENYTYLKKCLDEFQLRQSLEFRIYIDAHLSQHEKMSAARYYKKFYTAFTNFLYDEKNYYDNYVGLMVKGLRCFFNYLEAERKIAVGVYHKSFYVPKEEIPIIALSLDQLNYLIYNQQYNALLKEKNLDQIRDIFVLGCTVALRVSDLLQLSEKNLLITDRHYYLRVKSQKTATYTSVKLPEYAIAIVDKYAGLYPTLLPDFTPQYFNRRLKKLAALIPNNFEMMKIREKRGQQIVVYKDPVAKTQYKLSDHITTHTMRRTAITTMLNLGMPEHIVRKISGHAANSKEFYRYVQLSQQSIDQESDKVFEKLKQLHRKRSTQPFLNDSF